MPLPPDEPNDEERLEELPGDEGETPFNPGGPIRDDETSDPEEARSEKLGDTDPPTDSGLEAEDIYENGLPEAAGAEEPNAGNAVVDYDPTKDHRDKPK
ncbi:MAG TPA: hypothetical protein VN778_00255 [Verrucomicrobiae bacterium]|nr:hypothetical protein [Verrucomicrobiae bacterium]